MNDLIFVVASFFSVFASQFFLCSLDCPVSRLGGAKPFELECKSKKKFGRSVHVFRLFVQQIFRVGHPRQNLQA